MKRKKGLGGGKKGVIELQFNWIFVLVVGAVILVFFLSIVYKQKASSEIKLAGTLLSDFEAILSGSKVSTRTSHLLEIPNVDISFSCSDCNCLYRIGDVTKSYGDKAIFAPGRIKGRQMVIWSYDFNVPFRVTNLLYVASPEMKYVIAYSGGEESRDFRLASLLNATLPNNLDKVVVPLEQVPSVINNNYYKSRFIFFNANPSPLHESFQGYDVTAVRVDIPSGTTLDVSGSAKFFSSVSDTFVETEIVPFFGKAGLLAVLFSEDPESYNCNMDQVMERLNHVGDVYRQRIVELRSFAQSGNQNCLIYYNPSLVVGVDGFNEDAMDRIKGMYTAMKNNNDQAQLYSCPLLY
ncbi:hypothetical protein JW968_05395 [Candidatus Woesearchaeota archaeon]|nr:hypothetical protein [Candidatus Woesearchaeota archaeon]